jgi:BBSome-interacting protein 1
MSDMSKIKEIIPKNGIVFNEKIEFPEVLCKPKILPLKSVTLKKLEQMEREFEETNNKMKD